MSTMSLKDTSSSNGASQNTSHASSKSNTHIHQATYPPSIPVSQPRSHLTPLPLRDDYRTWVAWTAAAIGICSNAALITLWFKTHIFGGSITPQNRWHFIDDSNVISLIGVLAKILEIITVLVGGWWFSQLWSKQLNTDEGGHMVGLQALGMFGSAGTLLKTWISIFTRRFCPFSRFKLYVPLAIIASLFQYYHTAVMTIAVPSLSDVRASSSYSWVNESTFMSDPYSGTPCGNYSVDARVTCLDDWYIGNAIDNIFAFVQQSYDPSTTAIIGDLWPWPTIARNPDVEDGYRMFALICDNSAVIRDVNSKISEVNAISVTAKVKAFVPIITSQCAHFEQHSTINHLKIADTKYEVPLGIPILDRGQAAAQVTMNNLTLIITYPGTRTSNIHCAVNISIPPFGLGSLEIYFPLKGQLQWEPTAQGVYDEYDIFFLASVYRQPMSPFAETWVKGMGWSATPSRTIVSELLSRTKFKIETEFNISSSSGLLEDDWEHTLFSLEAYSMVMMADAVSHSLPSFIEGHPRSSAILPTQNEPFFYSGKQYMIGKRSTTHYFSITVIAINTVFLIFCVCHITFGIRGWLPDWNDPVVLVCTGITSGNIDSCTADNAGEVDPNVLAVTLKGRLDSEGKLVFE